MTNPLVEMMEEILKQDELFDIGAKLIRKSYDALIKNGFTKDEALTIVASQGNFVKTN